MAFPTVENTATSSQNTLATSHTVSLPTGIQVGELIVVCFGHAEGASTPTIAWGGTPDVNILFSAGAGASLAIWTRVANGTEGSTITVTTATAVRSAHNTYRISGHNGINNTATGTSTNTGPLPPSVTPIGGAQDYLFLAVGVASHGGSMTAGFPSTNYTGGISINTGGTASLQRVTASCYRALNTAAAEDPSDWTHSSAGTAESCAATLIFNPAGFPPTLPTPEQTGFRIRSGDTVGLNSNTGWEAALNTNASMAILDRPFRLRFLLKATEEAITDGYQLRVSINNGPYQLVGNEADPWTLSTSHNHYQVSAIPSDQYANEAATSQLLGAGSFTAGSGNEDNTAPSFTLPLNNETELEWAVVIRKLGVTLDGTDGAHTPDGTTFDFRVHLDDGFTFPTYAEVPRVTIANRPGHIGGTEVELSHRRFTVDKSGNIYYLSEYSDEPPNFGNVPVMMKSSDGGVSWQAMDEANAPALDDLEAGDLEYDPTNDLIHILIQGPSSDDVFYWTFACADHATTPDTWVTNQTVDTASSPNDQVTALHLRADGTIVGFYADADANQRLRYRIRSSGGVWGAEQTVDTEASVNFSGIATALDPANDTIHLFYHRWSTTPGSIWHRTLSSGNVLSGRTQVNQAGITINGTGSNRAVPITRAIIWDEGATRMVGIAYQASNDDVYWNQSAVASINFANQELALSGVRPNSLGSAAVTASIAVDDVEDDIWVIGTDTSTHALKYDTRVNGTWQGDTTWSSNIHQAVKAVVFTHAAGNGGARVLGFIHFDKNGHAFNIAGGVGFARYDEIVLSAPADTFTSGSEVVQGTVSGGTTYENTATVDATATVTPSAVAVLPASATVSATATIDVTTEVQGAAPVWERDATVDATATVTPTAAVVFPSTATVDATASINVTTEKIQPVSATVAGTATLTATALASYASTTTVDATATITVTTEVQGSTPIWEREASVDATATITATSQLIQTVSAQVDANATVTPTAVTIYPATATVGATATIDVTNEVEAPGVFEVTVTVDATASITASQVGVFPSTVLVPVEATVTATSATSFATSTLVEAFATISVEIQTIGVTFWQPNPAAVAALRADITDTDPLYTPIRPDSSPPW